MSSTVLVSDLVAAVRLVSGLRSNPLYSDDDVASFLDDASKELYDIFTASLQHWFRKTVSFTLAGGDTWNTFDLSTVPDFQMDQGLDYLTNNGRPRTVTKLGSFAERNAYAGGIFPFGGCELRYFTDGDTLSVMPPGSSAGSYQLIYTAQVATLALLQPIPPSGVTPASINNIAAGAGGRTAINFNNANWTSAYAGASLVIANVNIYVTANLNAESSTPVTATVQPANTRADVPQILTPWIYFLKVHASVALNAARQYPCPELQQKLEIERRRATSMAKMRSEGVQQAPITRRRVRFGGWVY